MSDADDLVAWERVRREQGLKNAFGRVRSAAFSEEASRDRATRIAADNLLDKALRRLRDGDAGAATALVERMLLLPFDDSDSEGGAVLAIDLFLWDAFRELARSEDEGWLEKALGVVIDDRVARSEWFDALRLAAVEEDFPAALRQRVLAVTGPTRTEVLLVEADQDSRVAAVVADLRALRDVTA